MTDEQQRRVDEIISARIATEDFRQRHPEWFPKPTDAMRNLLVRVHHENNARRFS